MSKSKTTLKREAEVPSAPVTHAFSQTNEESASELASAMAIFCNGVSRGAVYSANGPRISVTPKNSESPIPIAEITPNYFSVGALTITHTGELIGSIALPDYWFNPNESTLEPQVLGDFIDRLPRDVAHIMRDVLRINLLTEYL